MNIKQKASIHFPNVEEFNYHQFLLTLNHPAIIVSPAGKIQNANDSFLNLYKLHYPELIDHNLLELCKSDQAPTLLLVLTKMLHSMQTGAKASVQESRQLLGATQWTGTLIQQGIYSNSFSFLGVDVAEVLCSSLQQEHIKKSIIDHIPNHYIFWKDRNSVYMGCNQAFADVLGLKSCAEIVGKTDYDLPTTKEQSDAYRADDQFVINNGQQKLNIEEYQSLSDGKTRVLSTSKTPLLDEEGQVYGVLAIYSDITERKNLELSLEKAKNLAEEASLAKTEFIANMSHDIRTPLSGIIGMSNLLEQKAQNTEQREYAHMVNLCGEQLYALLNSVLEIISAGNQVEHIVKQESTDIRVLLHNLKELSLPSVTLKKITLNIIIEDSVPQRVITDQVKLHRILLNLLGNAIKFTQKGELSIHAKCSTVSNETTILECSVSDTGIGISPEAQGKVFERFYRASPSSKGHYSGFGVGLHIVQEYVKLLDGQIHLDSTVGKGSTFTVCIPITPDVTIPPFKKDEYSLPAINQHKAPPKPPEQSPYVSGSEPFILLVEDNDIALKILEAVVHQAKCTFMSANSAEKALELLKYHQFNLIITDIGLPGMSGNELTAEIRSFEKNAQRPAIPIIGLTAHNMEAIEQQSLRVGMNKIVMKPIRLDIFQAITQEFITNPQQNTHAAKPPLGRDLPSTEAELFQLEQYPLLDTKNGIHNLGTIGLLRELLELMIYQALPDDQKEMDEAHAQKNWPQIEKIAHKIKSGALYCGTIRLKYACQYLERYHQAGHRQRLNELYLQLTLTIKETKDTIQEWLTKGP